MTRTGGFDTVDGAVHVNVFHDGRTRSRPRNTDLRAVNLTPRQFARAIATNVHHGSALNGRGDEMNVVYLHGGDPLTNKKPFTRKHGSGEVEIVGIACIHCQRQACSPKRAEYGAGSGLS